MKDKTATQNALNLLHLHRLFLFFFCADMSLDQVESRSSRCFVLSGLPYASSRIEQRSMSEDAPGQRLPTKPLA